MSGTVTTEAQLNTAIAALDTTAVAGTYTITLANNITLDAAVDLDALNLHTGVNVVINGNGFTLDGGGVQRGIFVNVGNVTLQNLTIAHAVAQGGAGGLGVRDGGGGGAGLGGGLFVGSSATVTLSSVTFSSDQAKGGAGGNSFGGYNTVSHTPNGDGGYGGGGGMGGAGGFGIGFSPGGGGGLGNHATGGTIPSAYGQTTPGTGILNGGSSAGNGVVYPGGGTNTAQKGGKYGGGGGYGIGHRGTNPYAGSGAGGGGVAGSIGSLTGSGTGGNGGFGGGGGGGYGHGGAGGFGGGGGGGYYSSGIGGFGGGGGGGGSIAATGGFGGGSGATAGLKSGGAGGGGMGAGGDIFVANGGSLIMQAGTLSGGSVIGGAGGAGSHGAASGSAGSASGSGIFLNGNQSISLAPTAGQTLTVSDVIADQTGSGGTGTNAAAGVLLIGGGGLVALGAANTFTGGSTIQSGATLDLTASSAGGTGAITFASGSTGLLQIQNAALTSNQLTNTVSLLAAGDAIDLAGLTFAAGKSTATFSSGTLSVTNGTTTDKITLGGVSAGTTFVAVQDHATGIAALTPNFSVGSLSQLTTDLTSINSGGVASFGNVPYAFTLTAGIALGSVQTLNLLSASSLTLSGTAATGGGWNINAGTLVAGAAGLIGNGSVTVASGATLGLNNFAQTITDLSGAGAVTLGTGTLTEGTSTSTSFSGVISGTGGLVKQGTGTLTLSGVNSFTGPTTINAGEVLLSTGGSLSGNIVDGSTLAINETGNVTLAGTISGAGLLLQSGSGTTALTGTNTFSGAATITAGALQLGNGGTVGSLGSTSGVGGSGGALVFNRSDVVGFAPVIGGSVAVTQSGSGTTQLTGTDTYTGATTINAGTLEIGNGSTTGSIANTASIAGSGGVLAFDRSNSLTFAAKISGSVGLVQAGTGLTALTAANSFTGGTTIQAGTLQIGNGGAVGSLSGAITDNSTLAVNETGAVSLSGTISGSGKLVQAGSGTTTLGAANTFSGGIALNAGVLVLGHTGAAGSGAINFAAGTAQTLDFTIANAPTNTITGFEIGDTLDLTNAADVTATNLLAGNVLQIVRSGGGTIDLQLDAGVAGKFFFHTGDGVTGTAITESNVACYLIGTLILTDRGEVPVQDLAIGDSVVTLDGSAKPIKWIGRRSYASAFAAGNRDVVPIWIGAGALADGVPKRDLIVSPLHALYLDGRLVPAGALVNGVSIIQRLDIDPIRYFHIELARHDVIYAEGAPAETFVDCDSRGMFHNAEEFDALYPGDDSPCWAFCAPRVDSGPALVAIRRVIDRRAGIDVRDDTAPGPLQGFLDGMDGARLTGWAFDADHPNQPVVLEVLDGEGVIAQVTADRYRQDLEEAGIGDGRHAFDLMLGAGLAALPRQLHVRRAADGRELNGSPLLLRPAAGPDVLRQAIAAAAQGADAGTLGELVDVLLQGLDQVRHQHAASPRDDAKVAPLLAWRGGPRSAAPRALVIDDQLPQAGRDAGSNAIHSHIAALQALGWEVDCVAAHQGAADDKAAAALEASGVRCHRAPLVASVEEVLRRQRDAFDLVYLHRLSNAEAYAGLARAWQKRAHLIFSVADLHHLRLARQARAQSCIEVMSEARATREREFAAMRMVDAVITHSTAEAAYLADEAPGARVHVVPWAIAPQARVVSWAARDGIAFIGGYRHGPNPDAACFLAETVMPLVWQALPDVPLMIVGDEWPAALPWARDKRIRMVGRIRRLSDLFDLVRLTVAPLRFGAGLKGKVLDSFAAGIPCVMSPVAAEGMPLCATLQGLVGEDAAAIAAHIVRLHSDAGAAIACREAGLSMVESVFSAEAVAQALVPALGPKRARSARRKADAGSSPKIRGARKAAGKRHSAPGH